MVTKKEKSEKLRSNGVSKAVAPDNTPKQVTFSSGVTVTILPFPARLWQSVQSRAFRDFPDPLPPKKEVETVDGTEEVEDYDDPNYLAGMTKARGDRYGLLGDAVLELCVQFDVDKYKNQYKQVIKYGDVDPDDENAIHLEFLKIHALRTKQDYELLMVEATSKMIIDDQDIADRISFFRGKMESATAPTSDSSSTIKE